MRRVQEREKAAKQFGVVVVALRLGQPQLGLGSGLGLRQLRSLVLNRARRERVVALDLVISAGGLVVAAERGRLGRTGLGGSRARGSGRLGGGELCLESLEIKGRLL